MKYVLLFDGICNLCNSSVQFIIKHDKKNIFRFSSLQSNYGQDFLTKRNLPTNNLNSIILYEPEKAYYIKSTAVLLIAKNLSFPYNLLYIFIILPSTIRDVVYAIVAKNRYKWFGRKESCMVPSPELKNKFID